MKTRHREGGKEGRVDGGRGEAGINREGGSEEGVKAEVRRKGVKEGRGKL